MYFVSEIVMEEEFENPYMGPAMMTGAEVGFAWARMNRNSNELERLCSFAAEVSRDGLFDGMLDWASFPEEFMAVIQGDPVPTETDPDYEERVMQLRSDAAEFWMGLLFRCGVADLSCLNDPFFYDGFLEGVVAIIDPDYAE